MRMIESVAIVLLLAGSLVAAKGQEARTIPKTDAGNPGNIFLRGQKVVVELPQKGSWTLFDYEGRMVREFRDSNQGSVGKLPTGFYRFQADGCSNWVSVGVLEQLKAPTPLTSPIGIDVAMAWLYPREKMATAANLCLLAGANWVRDRLHWMDMEPERGRFSEWNRHDESVRVQTAARLRVLNVTATSAKWANPVSRRFPPDLRHTYHFLKAMAERWKGQVIAFEPWNEAEVERFGGHTGGEIASYQKAAYLGLKAGNPGVIVCLSPWVLNNRKQLGDLHENGAWGYFDTYNLHHYYSFEDLPRVYADHRAVSAGRPLWVSECGVLLEWTGKPEAKELTDTDLRIQAESVAKAFAISLHEGSAATFYFLLPHYSESEILWGLLRPDLTPRPGYVALAAVGRLLADARRVGKMECADESIRAFLFAARPEGKDRHVLVAWTTNAAAQICLPRKPEEMFDFLGRRLRPQKVVRLSTAPLFAVFRNWDASRLPTTPPPSPARYLEGSPSEVVLQASWPEEKVDLDESAYVISGDREEKIPVFVYNFGAKLRIGTLSVEAPEGWEANIDSAVQIESMGRLELMLSAKAPDLHRAAEKIERIRIMGDFGRAGETVLGIRFLPQYHE